jgi:hypothetical protein
MFWCVKGFREVLEKSAASILKVETEVFYEILESFSHIIIIIIIIIAIDFSLGGSSPYTSTDKTNENKYT